MPREHSHGAECEASLTRGKHGRDLADASHVHVARGRHARAVKASFVAGPGLAILPRAEKHSARSLGHPQANVAVRTLLHRHRVAVNDNRAPLECRVGGSGNSSRIIWCHEVGREVRVRKIHGRSHVSHSIQPADNGYG